MNRIDALFARLRSEKRRALMPFVTAGDPDLPTTAMLINELVSRGSHLVEVGIPYSDPIADGPVIAASYHRALERGVKVGAHLPDAAHPPRRGLGAVQRHADGLDGLLRDHPPDRGGALPQRRGDRRVRRPDRPRPARSRSRAALMEKATRRNLKLIQLITPTTPRERAVEIARSTTGFIYYVSVAGITGERKSLPSELVETVGWLRTQTDLPICIGFGISGPDQVRQLAPVADGLIIGSAIVRRLAEAINRPRAEVVREIGQFVGELVKVLENAGA